MVARRWCLASRLAEAAMGKYWRRLAAPYSATTADVFSMPMCPRKSMRTWRGASPRGSLAGMLLAVVLLGLLLIVALVVVPCIIARGLWRIPMPSAVRVAILLAVPAILVWWLATASDFADITSPGAALLPLSVIAGWLLGTSNALAGRVGRRLGSASRWAKRSAATQFGDDADDQAPGESADTRSPP